MSENTTTPCARGPCACVYLVKYVPSYGMHYTATSPDQGGAKWIPSARKQKDSHLKSAQTQPLASA